MTDRRDNQRSSTRSWLTWNGFYTLILCIVAASTYAWLVFFVLTREGLHTVERTRLLIVVTLIIAMLGFGGLLISRALFAEKTGDEFQNQFRLAREIFLVFSGIFGTIIGFYFGAQDTEATTQPLTVETNWAVGKLTVTMTGGAGPFTGILTPKDNDTGEVQTTDSRVLTFTMASCAPDADIVVVDGRGHRAQTTVDCAPSSSDGSETNSAGNTGANDTGGNASSNMANASGNVG